MADNTVLDAGSGGDTVASASLTFSGDTAKVQVTSSGLLTGSEGSWTYTLLVGGAGAVGAGVQRMTLASDDPAVASLAIVDDWDESDRAKVNLIVGQAGIAAGAGAVGATVPRVTLASDDPAVTALQLLDNAVSGSGFNITQLNGVNVSMGNGASGTGVLRVTVASDSTGVIGATQSGTWNITNISGTVSLPTGAATAANQSTTNTSLASIDTSAGRIAGKYVDFDTGAGTDSAVAIGILLPASGGAVIGGTSSNPLRVDVTGTTTQPVSNADITAAAASLNVIDDWDESDRAKVNIIVGQAGVAAGAGAVGATVQRMTLANDDPAVTALQLIDDAVSGAGFNITQMNGVNVTMGNGASGTGVQRVTIANDSTGILAGVTTVTTVTTVSAVSDAQVQGKAAHGAAVSGNPVLQGLEARTSDGTAVDSGDAVRAVADVLGKQVVLQGAIADLTWNYAAPAGGLVTTAGVTAKAAAGAGIRNYVTSAQVINSHQTTSTEVLIRDGAAGTVLERLWAQAAGGGCSVKFDPPLRGTANTLIEIAEVTATGTAGVLVNLQGYTAAN